MTGRSAPPPSAWSGSTYAPPRSAPWIHNLTLPACGLRPSSRVRNRCGWSEEEEIKEPWWQTHQEACTKAQAPIIHRKPTSHSWDQKQPKDMSSVEARSSLGDTAQVKWSCGVVTVIQLKQQSIRRRGILNLFR